MSSEFPSWHIKGELILNCNCTVFCPCVISLGVHYPTEGHCQAWLGVNIYEGRFGNEDLNDLKVAMLLDIPGRMSRGDWKAGIFIDQRASAPAYEGLSQIFSGKAKGTTHLFSLLISEHLGTSREPIEFKTEKQVRSLTVGKKIIGSVEPITGADETQAVSVTNTNYWMGPDITISKALKGRVRAFGRVWDFEDRSAEICQINWSGP